MSNHRNSHHFASALMAATLLTGAMASAALTKKGDAQVVVTALGPAGLKIESKTSSLDVKEKDDVVIVVQLTTLDSGIELRNKHMKEKCLETQKFPTAELHVPRSALKLPAAGASVDGVKAQGNLTLHGQTKPVTFTYGATRDGQAYKVSGNVKVNLNDFGMEQPSFAGVKVKPDVDVAVTFSATDG